MPDLRYAVRSLLRTPGLTLTALLTLALGIGANTALFSIINGVFLQPPPGVRDSNGLVWLSEVSTEWGRSMPIGFSYPLFDELRARRDLFSDIAAFTTVDVDFVGPRGDPERLTAEVVTGDYFSVLRMRPEVGRGFLPEEDRTPGSHPVAVIGHELWQNRFGSDPGVVGRPVTINGGSFTVVGVAPEGFRGLRHLERPADLWLPVMMYPVVMPTWEDPLGIDYGVRRFGAVSRLAPAVPRARAVAVMHGLHRGLAAEEPEAFEGVRAELFTFRGIAGPMAGDELLVAGFAGLITLIILLIACGNVANLLLARAAGRRREIAIRAAMGASRGRIVRQLLVESLVLTLAGGAAAILVALWMLDLFFALAPIPFPLPVALNGLTLLTTLALAIGTAFVAGLSPALRSSRWDVTPDLKGITGAAEGRLRPQAALVAGQIALSCMLLVGAGVMVRAMWDIVVIDRRVPARDEVVAMTFNPLTQGYRDEAAESLKARMLERVAAVPGVESVTLTSVPPYRWSVHSGRTVIANERRPELEKPLERTPLLHVVRPDYLRTLQIPLVRGRAFTAQDREESPGVVLVNEAAARRFWPGEDPLGKRIRLGADSLPWQTVVGVVANARYDEGEPGEAGAAVYASELQRGPLGPEATLLIRTRGEAVALVRPLQAALREVEPDMPIYRIRTLGQLVDERWAEGWIAGGLMVAVGGLALLLALIGLHGLVAYTVEQRTREVGIRVSLGASRQQILRLFGRDVLRVAGVGVALGLVLAGVLAVVLSRVISDLKPLDIGTFAAVAAILLGVALFASYIPARRATRVDPMVALRAD